MKKEQKDMYKETITWWDDICPESYRVAIPAYSLKISKAKKIDDFTTEVTVQTPIPENLDAFLADHEEGDYRELDVISLSCKKDEDYVNEISRRINALKKMH